MRAFKILFATTLSLGVAAVGLAVSGADDWFSDEGNKLAMMVAKLENGKLCGGVLRVNRATHGLVFEPAPSEMGCKNGAEAAQADVRSVKSGDGAGFLVELQRGKERKLLLIPLPHAQWLLATPIVKENNTRQQVESAGLRGPDGEPMRVGGAAGGGPKTKPVEIPANVAADTKRAVDAVLSALGR